MFGLFFSHNKLSEAKCTKNLKYKFSMVLQVCSLSFLRDQSRRIKIVRLHGKIVQGHPREASES